MSDHVFKSKYTMEEIEGNFKDSDFFGGIKEGPVEALAYERGENQVRKRLLGRGAFLM